MKSYDKLLNRYEQFAKIYEALKRIKPRRLYKFTETGDWFVGMLHACTQSAVKFNLVITNATHLASTFLWDDKGHLQGYAVKLYRLGTYKIEQLKLTDLPAYVSAPYKTLLYDKLLMRKVKILED